MKNKKNNKGFTLVELLVVIAIIGILAVVAVPALFKNINKAKVADLEADYNAIKSATLSYYTDHNEYPDVSSTNTTEELSSSSELSSYMDNVPVKPSVSKSTGYYELELSSNSLVLNVIDAKLDESQVKKIKEDLSGIVNSDLKAGENVKISLTLLKNN